MPTGLPGAFSGTLAGDQLSGHIGAGQCNRLHGRYMHGHILGSRFIAFKKPG